MAAADRTQPRGSSTLGVRPVVLVFAMPFGGHFAAIRPLIAGLAESGSDVVVLTHERFAAETAALGARFHDLFGAFPLEPVDPAASPAPVRYVSYAGRYVDEILALVRELDPALVVYEAHALVGHVVARILGLPYVAVSVSHDFRPDAAAAFYEADARVVTTAETARAVERLRSLGLDEITHLSFATSLSPYLNIYCEPPEFLAADGRRSFEPVAFFGSIVRRPVQGTRAWFGSDGRTRVYVSFGSYLYQAFRDDYVAALTRVVDGLATDAAIEAIVSLGSPHASDETLESFARRNVRVERWVDQSCVLAEADVFVTHHGLPSTHDAIDHLVPMLSFPFFGDQPSQAAFCQSVGIALPLGARGALPDVADVAAAIGLVRERRLELRERLEVVRGWEDAVIAQRPAVIARILSFVASRT